MTPEAARLEELQKIAAIESHRTELAECHRAAEMADARARAAVSAAESADWWSRYGFILGLAGGVIAGGAAVAIGAAAVQKLKLWARPLRRCRFNHCTVEVF